MQLTLGQKIRYFRERAGMSQLDLEVAIDASTGSISRMESGKVNPTKETLKLIATALQLSSEEISLLFELYPILATSEEIHSAIKEVYSLLEREDKYLYLIDHWVNIHAVSKGFLKLVGISEVTARKVLGRNFYDIAFDAALNFETLLGTDNFIKIMAVELYRTRHETQFELYQKELIERLQNNPKFKLAWDLSNGMQAQVLDASSKKIEIQVGNTKQSFYFIREKLKSTPRFEIIEYVPTSNP